MEAGKHVLCEKPLSLSIAEIEQLKEVRDRTGRHIEEAYVFRNHPQWARIAEILRSGMIGEPRGMQVTMAMQFHDPNDIRNKLELGGGALYDMGGYVISACSLVFRRAPIRVVAAIDRDPVMGIDRLSTALLDYGGAHATITVGTQAGPAGRGSHQLLSVLGSTGWLRMDYPLGSGGTRRVPRARRRRNQHRRFRDDAPSDSNPSTSTRCRASGSPGTSSARMCRCGPSRRQRRR